MTVLLQSQYIYHGPLCDTLFLRKRKEPIEVIIVNRYFIYPLIKKTAAGMCLFGTEPDLWPFTHKPRTLLYHTNDTQLLQIHRQFNNGEEQTCLPRQGSRSLSTLNLIRHPSTRQGSGSFEKSLWTLTGGRVYGNHPAPRQGKQVWWGV